MVHNIQEEKGGRLVVRLCTIVTHGLRATTEHPCHAIGWTRQGYSGSGEKEEGEEVPINKK